MKGETHALIGVTATASMMSVGVIETSLITLGMAAVASYLPDIDHDGAAINRSLGITKAAYGIIAVAILYFNRSPYAIVAAIMMMAVAFSRHRAITHSLLALIVVWMIAMKIGSEVHIGIVSGYGLHLLADYFTAGGIEILYPNQKNFKSPIYIRTGGMAENVVSGLMMLGMAYNGWILFLR